jgi:hypothetical protein
MTIQLEDATRVQRMTAAEFFTPQAHRVLRVLGILSSAALVLVVTVCSYRAGHARGMAEAQTIMAGRGLYRWLAIEGSQANGTESRPNDAPPRVSRSAEATSAAPSFTLASNTGTGAIPQRTE